MLMPRQERARHIAFGSKCSLDVTRPKHKAAEKTNATEGALLMCGGINLARLEIGFVRTIRVDMCILIKMSLEMATFTHQKLVNLFQRLEI